MVISPGTLRFGEKGQKRWDERKGEGVGIAEPAKIIAEEAAK